MRPWSRSSTARTRRVCPTRANPAPPITLTWCATVLVGRPTATASWVTVAARSWSSPRLELAGATERAELFLYPGKSHLFADSSLPSYDETAATLLVERVLDFLRDV